MYKYDLDLGFLIKDLRPPDIGQGQDINDLDCTSSKCTVYR